MEIDENRWKSMKASFDDRTPKAILSILTILNIVNFASNSLYRYGIPGPGFGLATPPHTKPWNCKIDENRWKSMKCIKIDKNRWNWYKSMKNRWNIDENPSLEIDENRWKSMKANFDGRTVKAILSILTILNIVNFASNSLYPYGIPGLGFGLATPPHTKPWIGKIDENRWNRWKSIKIDRWTSMKLLQIYIKSMKIDDEIRANL